MTEVTSESEAEAGVAIGPGVAAEAGVETTIEGVKTAVDGKRTLGESETMRRIRKREIFSSSLETD